jgi:prolycopene isomerase
MVDTPSYNTADETDPKAGLESIKKHPGSYLKFLSYLNRSAKSLLRQYFTDPEIFNFFDKLTSTYCYATVEEAPAVLAAVMFVDNHVGGSYYPAGSTLFLPGVLEKAIEEHGGDMRYNSEVVSILFENGKPCGALLKDGTKLFAGEIIYSGTVWILYGKLLDPSVTTKKRRDWAKKQEPTYPSVVLYAAVDARVIPSDTAPVEMLVGNPEQIDESEVTAYILSIDDRSLCPEGTHTVVAIGPTFQQWNASDSTTYQEKKERERERLFAVLERRFPGFTEAVQYAEIATPHTIERYTLKNGGAVAGPKQMLGQHMFRRQHTRTDWDNLFCCGESTVMGTGTPTVTTSGLSAANAVLKKRGLEPFVYQKNQKNFVRVVERPFTSERLYESAPEPQKAILKQAMRCHFCEHPTCSAGSGTDIPGVMRRVAVGNFVGAKKRFTEHPADERTLGAFENDCIWKAEGKEPVAIRTILRWLMEETP